MQKWQQWEMAGEAAWGVAFSPSATFRLRGAYFLMSLQGPEILNDKPRDHFWPFRTQGGERTGSGVAFQSRPAAQVVFFYIDHGLALNLPDSTSPFTLSLLRRHPFPSSLAPTT